MNAALLLTLNILNALPSITAGVEHLWAYITKTREALQQSGEWTDDAEKAYQQRLLAKNDAPEWQKDQPEIGTGTPVETHMDGGTAARPDAQT